MNHLTTDEILQFVSFTTVDDESLRLASRVNSHILQCEECRNMVIEYQKHYDASDYTEQRKEKTVWSDEKAAAINPVQR